MATERMGDGGPAFPVIGAPSAPEDYPGMTLRDYFAVHAGDEDIRAFIPETIGGTADLMVSLGWITQRARDGDVTRSYTQDQRRRLRQWARYQHADAMLAARGAA